MTFSSYPVAGSTRTSPYRPGGRYLLVGSAAALAFVAVSCNKPEPKGQVIAVANGEEITAAELNEEARARGLSIGNNAALRATVMRDLVDRKLLVQQALRDQVDRTPQHLLAARRLSELLLVQEMVAARRGSPDLSDAEVRDFIKAHPHAFDQRASIHVAQITPVRRLPPELQAGLSTAPTMEDAQRLLAAARIAAARSEHVWDSADLPEVTTERLLASNGEPTLVPAGRGLAVVQVLSVTPRPMPPEQRLSAARQWITQRRTNDALDGLITKVRSNARVEYQRGFEPSS
jgi:peptidyl-prolyl cis-trans isomerase C